MANGAKNGLYELRHLVEPQPKRCSEHPHYARSLSRILDAVLGKERLSTHDVVITSGTNETDYVQKNPEYSTTTVERGESVFISSTAILQDFEIDRAKFAAMLELSDTNSATEASIPKELHSFVQEYSCVFPSKRPGGLAPQRNEDFKVELEKDAVSQKRIAIQTFDEWARRILQKIWRAAFRSSTTPSRGPWRSSVLFVSKKDGG